MKQRTGTLTVTLPIYDDTKIFDLQNSLCEMNNVLNEGKCDLDREDSAIIRVGDELLGVWEVTIFNPEAGNAKSK